MKQRTRQHRGGRRAGQIIREPIECKVPADLSWLEGDVFTIDGHKLTAQGWIKDCRPGEETRLITRVEKS